jgi:hypothetical protein
LQAAAVLDLRRKPHSGGEADEREYREDDHRDDGHSTARALSIVDVEDGSLHDVASRES